MAKKSNTEITVPSVLSFERKLSPSNGYMAVAIWGQSTPGADKPEVVANNFRNLPRVPVTEATVRGTISNRPSKDQLKDPAKLDADIEKPNIQTVDTAHLPGDCDTLVVHFTLNVLGNLGEPSACNNGDFEKALNATVADYKQTQGMGELARRYATNIANGRFLWRNRTMADELEVVVCCEDQCLRFDALEQPMREFPDTVTGDLATLTDWIEQALAGDGATLIQVYASARLGAGQEVFPSQEMIADKNATQNPDKSKVLHQVDGGAGMHPQKLGNALRTIDTWHYHTDEIGVIPVEAYGAVTSKGRAFRAPRPDATDFYSLFDRWIAGGEAIDPEQQHFVMAMIARGGVFGKSAK